MAVLEYLHIENVAVVKKLDIEFDSYAGESFYVDVAANQQTITTYIDYTKFTVENVIF